MATVNFVHDGDAIDYTPTSAVNAGDVVVQGDLVGVAKKNIAANALGALHVKGVFDFPKATTSGSAITAGTKLYWDASSEVATSTAGGNKYIGKAVQAADADDTTVRVRMEQ